MRFGASRQCRTRRADRVGIGCWYRLFAAGVISDALTYDGVAWWPVVLVVGLVGVAALPWRRTHPVAVSIIASAPYVVLHSALLIADRSSPFVGSATLFLLLYAIVRWASGRDAIVGLSIVTVGALMAQSTSPLSDGIVAAALFWLIPILTGITVRTLAARRIERVVEARLHERQQLARELHDTVAHHVSAIAIQAQAGKAVSATDPSAAVAALDVIAGQASKTLVEMRKMVGALRDDGAAELVPQRGIDDIARIASDSMGSPRVDVRMSGDLADLAPSIEAGLFRLAQEAITNARRHARHASIVTVEVDGRTDEVRLVVADDGEPTGNPGGSGFGLIGMAERVKLLGGTLSAGPGPQRGWAVIATIPRDGSMK